MQINTSHSDCELCLYLVTFFLCQPSRDCVAETKSSHGIYRDRYMLDEPSAGWRAFLDPSIMAPRPTQPSVQWVPGDKAAGTWS